MAERRKAPGKLVAGSRAVEEGSGAGVRGLGCWSPVSALWCRWGHSQLVRLTLGVSRGAFPVSVPGAQSAPVPARPQPAAHCPTLPPLQPPTPGLLRVPCLSVPGVRGAHGCRLLDFAGTDPPASRSRDTSTRGDLRTTPTPRATVRAPLCVLHGVDGVASGLPSDLATSLSQGPGPAPLRHGGQADPPRGCPST